MAEDNDQERTESATPHKREEARKEGRVAKSQDLAVALSLAGVLSALSAVAPQLGRSLQEFIALSIHEMPHRELSAPELQTLMVQGALAAALGLAGIVGAAMLVGLATGFLQVGWMMNFDLLQPKAERISPMTGFNRLFSMEGVGNFFVGCAKMCAVTASAYVWFAAQGGNFPQYSNLRAEEILPSAGAQFSSLAWRVAVVLLVIGIVDYLLNWWKLEKSLRMSKQEVKEENKSQDGDPHVKQRIRSIQRANATRRMMQDVPKATVVITNPTHVAVALLYDPMLGGAPVVLAIGKDLVAQRIKEIARENNIPIHEEPPLARALLKYAEVGREIPADFYRAVAQILAFLMRKKAAPAPMPSLAGGRP
jgi:flagellar biosynthetic protein FlhB